VVPSLASKEAAATRPNSSDGFDKSSIAIKTRAAEGKLRYLLDAWPMRSPRLGSSARIAQFLGRAWSGCGGRLDSDQEDHRSITDLNLLMILCDTTAAPQELFTGG
jgi:hypothetical protein